MCYKNAVGLNCNLRLVLLHIRHAQGILWSPWHPTAFSSLPYPTSREVERRVRWTVDESHLDAQLSLGLESSNSYKAVHLWSPSSTRGFGNTAAAPGIPRGSSYKAEQSLIVPLNWKACCCMPLQRFCTLVKGLSRGGGTSVYKATFMSVSVHKTNFL